MLSFDKLSAASLREVAAGHGVVVSADSTKDDIQRRLVAHAESLGMTADQLLNGGSAAAQAQAPRQEGPGPARIVMAPSPALQPPPTFDMGVVDRRRRFEDFVRDFSTYTCLLYTSPSPRDA